MTIVIAPPKTPQLPTTDLNTIPVGTVFQGTIISHVLSGKCFTGTFFKAAGPTALVSRVGEALGIHLDCSVVKLDVGEYLLADDGTSLSNNCFLWCRVVENYRPAKQAELKLTF